MQMYVSSKKMLSVLLLLPTLGMYANKDDNGQNVPRKIFSEIIHDTKQPPKEKAFEILERVKVWLGEKKEQAGNLISSSDSETSLTKTQKITEEEVSSPSNDSSSNGEQLNDESSNDVSNNSEDLNLPIGNGIVKVVQGDGNGDPIDPKDPESGNCVVRMFKKQTKVQLASLIGMASILGYAGYCAYVWWQERTMSLNPLRITEREHEVISSLMDNMKQDVEHISAGNRQPSMVKQFDLSEVNAELAAELNMLQSLFVDLYNSCEENKENIQMLDCMYKNIQQGVDMMLAHAEIITLENEEVVEQELVA
jgi:hypothetical protein